MNFKERGLFGCVLVFGGSIMAVDTIAAISTALGEGGIGIVRMSGPRAVEIAKGIFKPAGNTLWPTNSHRLTYGHIVNPSGAVIDEVLVAVMRAPHSYTTEDIVEINSHGGMVVMQQILDLLLGHGARLAEPGEFTKRAFLNGRIDLVQAEAVIDLIRAKSDAAAKAASSQLQGYLSREIKEIWRRLIEVLAHMEAMLDFPEDDIEELSTDTISREIIGCQVQVRELIKRSRQGKILREGVYTAIVGPPNVGKSSLLNALLQDDRAIVSPYAGTTRDVIEESVTIGGIVLRIADTAGIRRTEDEVEQLGVSRSRVALSEAELVLCVLDGTCELGADGIELVRLLREKPHVLIINKIDLPQRLDSAMLKQYVASTPVKISALTGEGLEQLRQEIHARVWGKTGMDGVSEAMVMRVRHREDLEECLKRLTDALDTLEQGLPIDFITIDVRGAAEALGRITGENVADEVIEQVFAEFCVGK